MAVSSGNSTSDVRTLFTIETEQSQKSISSLRQEIKNLKDQLLNLDKGTDEYRNTMRQLADDMHDLKELNEEVAKSSSDFGDRLSNITVVMQGGVGAIQGVTSALSLMGVKIGDNDKLINTLVKSMSLLQSLSSIDNANKAFLRLKNSISLANFSIKGLGAAMKTFAMSNPFTAILVAATALVGIFSAISGKLDDIKEKSQAAIQSRLAHDLEVAKKEAEALNNRLAEMFNVIKNGSSEQIEAVTKESDLWNDAINKVNEFQNRLKKIYSEDAIAAEDAEQTRKARIEAALKTTSDRIKEIREQQEKLDAAIEHRNEAEIARLETQAKQEGEYVVFLQQEIEQFNLLMDRINVLDNVRTSLWNTDNEEIAKNRYTELYEIVKAMQTEFSKSEASEWPILDPNTLDDVESIKNAFYSLQSVFQSIRNDIIKNGPIQMMGEQSKDQIIQTISLAQAETEKSRREARKKAAQQWKQHLNDLLTQYKRWLSLIQKQNELARKRAEIEAKELYTRIGPDGTLQRQSKNWGAGGKKGYSDNIVTAIAERDAMRAAFTAEQAELQKNIQALEEYLQKLKDIKNPTKEVKEAIEDTANEIELQQLNLRELNLERAESVRAANLEIDVLVAEYRQRNQNAHAIEAETEAMVKLRKMQRDAAKDAMQGANWWNGYKEGDLDQARNIDNEIKYDEEEINVIRGQIEGINTALDQLEERADYQRSHGIFDESAYNEERANLLNQQMELIQQAADKEVEINQKKLNKKKLQEQSYVAFAQGIASAISQVLNEMSEADGVSFEAGKKMKIAAATIDMLSGAVSAYAGAQNLGMPLGPIMGAINAAAVITMGLMNIQKIKNTTMENASSAASAGASQPKVITQPPQIVNLNDVNDEVELPDQRVYVLESDITNAQRSVQVVQNNSTI